MKSKLPPHTWLQIKCICLLVVPIFLCTSLRANENNPSLNHLPNLNIPAIPETDNFQDIIITGKVTDENGDPISGATVTEKGNISNSVVSDKNGNYSLKVKDKNSSVLISYVGYLSREVTLGSSSNLNVRLELTSKNLDDVIVVGYGTQKKKELTNAVVQVTGKEIRKSNALSVSNSISGRLAGVFVNQRSSVPGFDDAEILVRGPKTYRNSSALIVIDGVANADPDGLNRLDPNDIESISVLKDASAAIYGAQSAGGVILVTTKRGKTGKPSFDFSTTHTYQSPTMKVRSANAFEYMKALNDRRKLDGSPVDFPDAFVNEFTTGKRRPEDWWNALVGPAAPQSRQSLTMRGGTEKVKYFISLGTAIQRGILRGDDKTKLRQYNVRSNIDVAVTKDFDIGVDLSIREKATQTPQAGPGGNIDALAFTSPLQEAYIGGDYRYPGEGWSQLNPAAMLLSPGYNKYLADVYSGTVKFKYNFPFVKGLAVEGFASIVKTVNYDKSFNYTWFYYEKTPAGDIIKKPSRGVESVGLNEYFTQSLRNTQNLKLSYNTVLNNDHKIGVFVAYEQMDYKDNNFTAGRRGYESPAIDQLFAGSPDRANWNTNGGASENARQNYFGRASYEYKGKYLLGFSARYDGSNIFPKKTRFGFFPQASAAWVLSKESFIPQTIFSNLKLRASWGRLGNDRVAPFQYLSAFNYAPGWVVGGADVRGVSATTTPNQSITWEVSETSDLGLEAAFLKNTLTLEIDLYKTKTSNILGRKQASIPAYTGLFLPDQNIGKMENKGFEVQVGYRESIGKLNFKINGQISYTENKIIYFDETPQAEKYQKLEGQPLGSRLVFKSIGIYRNDADVAKYVGYPGARVGTLIFEDLNKDGKIDFNDRYMFNGTGFPKMQYGINIGLDYKNFDITILLQGQSGAKWQLYNGLNSGAAGNGLAYVANNSFTLENTNALLPIIPQGGGIANEGSDFYYHDIKWMRFKSVELGYNLPQNLLSKVKISALRAYVSGDNLFMLSNNLKKYGSGDPEFLNGRGSTYPNMRTFSFGINLTF